MPSNDRRPPGSGRNEPTWAPAPPGRPRGRRNSGEGRDLTPLLERFQQALGYRFREPRLLEEALIHASQGVRQGGRPFSNEKLEFLGDRVLGLLIADALFHRYPDEPVGSFAARFAGLVDRDTLAGIARQLDLQSFLQFAGDEGERSAKRMTSPLADGCEAVIGALYLDGGLAAAGAFIDRYWQPLFERMRTPARDAKSRLQEWAQARGLPRPVYRETGRAGPAHLPMFTIEAELVGWPPAVGEGDSKRHAEQAAAARLLAELEGKAAAAAAAPAAATPHLTATAATITQPTTSAASTSAAVMTVAVTPVAMTPVATGAAAEPAEAFDPGRLAPGGEAEAGILPPAAGGGSSSSGNGGG